MFEQYSISELERYINSKNYSIFVYDSLNQNKNISNHRFVLKFTSALFFTSPDRICFKNNSDMLVLNQIMSIVVDNCEQMVGTIITIKCGERNKNEDFVLLIE